MGLLPSVTFVTVQGGARWESILHSETYTPFFRSKTVRNGSGFGFGSEMLISRALLVYRVHLQLFRRGSIDVCERLPAFNPPGLLRLFIYHISALCMCVCVIPHPFPGQTSLSLLCSVHVQCRISNRLLLSSFLTATSRFEDRAIWASGDGTKVSPPYRRIRFPAFCVVVFFRFRLPKGWLGLFTELYTSSRSSIRCLVILHGTRRPSSGQLTGCGS